MSKLLHSPSLLAAATLAFAQPGAAPRPRVELERAVAELAVADASRRAEAACEVGRHRSEASHTVPALMRLLADDVLVGPVECGMSPWLRRSLEAKPEEWRRLATSPAREAARALAEIGRAALDPLLRALEDASFTVR